MNGKSNDSDSDEMVSSFLSSMGCSWDMNETVQSSNEKAAKSSMRLDRRLARKVSHPSFSLANDDQAQVPQDGDCDEVDTKPSPLQREAVQSKASKLMSRRAIHLPEGEQGEENEAHQGTAPLPQTPQRTMLENILDSFDQLVDARIRAYARILSNHVRVLLESNNQRAARIGDYKLQVLLEFAANHLLFDSISTDFKLITTTTEDDDGKLKLKSGDSHAAKVANEETSFSAPIELTVEIRSPRFLQGSTEGEKSIASPDSSRLPHQGNLTFRARGKVSGDRILIGRNFPGAGDTDRCLTEKRAANKNSKTEPVEHCRYPFSFDNLDVEIDCEVLLSQMMEEASKVVTMAVELTNLAWTNNIRKQEDLNNSNNNNDNDKNTMNNHAIADGALNAVRNTANIIVDEDDASDSNDRISSLAMTGKRSRCEEHLSDHGTQNGTSHTVSNQVSEFSIRPPTLVVCDEEPIGGTDATNDVPFAIAGGATITNLHVLDQHAEERKTNYFVSVDLSYESSSSESEHHRDAIEERPQPQQRHRHARTKEGDKPLSSATNHEDTGTGDESYDTISAQRACHIVDFVLAGDIFVPSPVSSNKKLRTK
mmetsp:Transcript_103015/g.210017  ORF Transcript_103015/g.210017 Transcript_103015/m.210017 type:complete len:597 (+) Transcript_103015:173-1963(+)